MKPDLINNWQRIWKKRSSFDALEGTILERLIAIDGFDTPLGLMKENDWKAYSKLFAHRAGVLRSDSLFEIGCGAGAFLYPFYESGHAVSGIDYSQELIQIAQSIMPTRRDFLIAMEASSCPIEPFSDVLIANHVIHYFPSNVYAMQVVDIMLRKATRVVILSGVPDIELKQQSEQARRGLLTHEEYEEKYRGLEILYYDKSQFSRMAADHGYSASFFEHEMPGFAQNKYRFDCVMKKS